MKPNLKLQTPLIILVVLTALRLVIAAYFPISNDEAYYWDWGREPQLSYFDHPPGVGYLAWLGQLLPNWGNLAARWIMPFLYLAASLLIMGASARFLVDEPVPENHQRAVYHTMLLTQLIPGFSFLGVALLPDGGLLFGLSLCLYLISKIHNLPKLRWFQGIAFGIALGICGLFKYHALPLAGGLAMGLIAYRRKIFGEWAFWVWAVVGGLACTLPVWIWNYRHDWASLLYQTNHGFGGLQFKVQSGIAVFVGLVISLGPFFLFPASRSLLNWVRRCEPRLKIIAIAGALPLLLILSTVAWFKQLLPHWFVPAFWVAIPFLVIFAKNFAPVGKGIAIYGVLVAQLMPAVIAIPSARSALLELQQGDPGAGYELTLWTELGPVIAAHPLLQILRDEPAPAYCHAPGDVLIASIRWFWVAQVAYATGFKVLNLDPDHRSYYTYRDSHHRRIGCRILIVGDDRHYDPDTLSRRVTIVEKQPILVPGHHGLKLFIGIGQL